MSDAHMVVGATVAVLNLVAAVWCLLTYRRAAVASRPLTQALALTHTLALAQGAFGLYLLAGGFRAPARLHYVYGLLPSLVVAFAYSARTEDARRNLLVFGLSAAVIAALAARAFTTGAS